MRGHLEIRMAATVLRSQTTEFDAKERHQAVNVTENTPKSNIPS